MLVSSLDDGFLKAFLVMETLVVDEKEEMETLLRKMGKLEASLEEDLLWLEMVGSP